MRRVRIYGYYLLLLLIFVFLAAAGLIWIRESGEGEGGKLRQETESRLDLNGGNHGENAVLNGDEKIRVLLMSTGYEDLVHPLVELSADSGLLISEGGDVKEWNSAEPYRVSPDDAGFQKGNIRVEPLNESEEVRVHNIERGYGTPSYKGIIELRTTAEGVAVINELLLEDYLCKVVPSEMPASYELEALKAQAVCARSYAYRQMAQYGYPEYEAHVNDSTDYQVYNNSEAHENCSRAVYETQGQVVWYQGSVAVTYYYSTSCGKTTTVEAWGSGRNEGNAYLESVQVCGENGDFEKALPWYRWTASIPVQTLSNLIGLNTGVDVGVLSSVEVTKTGAGGVALQIVAFGDKGSVTVDTENKIRKALGGSGYTITKNDGSVVDSTALLPSAFFSIERQGETFVIHGGGFGHGIGMSQNGANEMAKQGKNYIEILTLFYTGVTVE